MSVVSDDGSSSDASQSSHTASTKFVIGVSLCIASATLSTIGVNLQKLAHMQNARVPEALRRPYIRLWRWWFGMAGVVGGAVLDFVSLGFAPQIIVSAFGSSTLVINAWIAPYVVGERLTREELAATLVIAGSAIVVVLCASDGDHNDSLVQIYGRFRQVSFALYAVGVVFMAAVLFRIFYRCEAACRAETLRFGGRQQCVTNGEAAGGLSAGAAAGTPTRGDPALDPMTGETGQGVPGSRADDRDSGVDEAEAGWTGGWFSGGAEGIWGGNGQGSRGVKRLNAAGGVWWGREALDKLLSFLRERGGGELYSRRRHVMSVSCLSGLMGAQSLILAKASAIAIDEALSGGSGEGKNGDGRHTRNPFASFEPYLILLGLIACVLLQTHTLNLALERFNAVLVMPIFQVTWLSSGVLGAGIFYHEFSSIRGGLIALMLVAFSVMGWGILRLARLQAARSTVGDSRHGSGASAGPGGSAGLMASNARAGNGVLDAPVPARKEERIAAAIRSSTMAHRGFIALDGSWYKAYEHAQSNPLRIARGGSNGGVLKTPRTVSVDVAQIARSFRTPWLSRTSRSSSAGARQSLNVESGRSYTSA